MNDIDQHKNLLPYDGEVLLLGKIFEGIVADNYFIELLNNIDWHNDSIIIFGKKIITKRKIAWYGDYDFYYRYSGTTRKSLFWKDSLQTFNSCLLNLYHDGDEGMSWHSDKEKTLKKNGTIACVSLGAERFIYFKHKQTNEVIKIKLLNGSLLIMKGLTQSYWVHSIPKTKTVKNTRISLTFREFIKSS